MNLRALANSATQRINPNVTVSLARSIGYGIGPGYSQIPAYAPAVTGPGQVQALDGAELKHLEGLNVQGVYRALYMYGSLAGVVRPDSKGGDLVTLPDGTLWLIVKVLESWPDWTKAVICYQEPANNG